jgi:hypothetical protein
VTLNTDRIAGWLRVQYGRVHARCTGSQQRVRRTAALAPIEVRPLRLAKASLSVLGYDHDLPEPGMHARNGRDAITRDVALSPNALNGLAVGSFGKPASRTET